MQTILRRMSLTAPRSFKQLRKLWTDFLNVRINEQIDTNSSKVLLLFLDGIIAIPDQPSQALIIDEFVNDFIDFVECLLNIVKLCVLDLNKVYVTPEDLSLCSEVVFKCLNVTELFLSCKGTKVDVKEILKEENGCVSTILDCLVAVGSIPHSLSLIRILKNVIVTDQQITEMIRLNGFDILTELARKEKQAALTLQVMSFFRHFSEHYLHNLVSNVEVLVAQSPKLREGRTLSRHRNHSVSSTGSAPYSHAVSSNIVTVSNRALSAHHQAHHGADSVAEEDESIAAKGFNMAFSVVSELLKFSPLGANWLGTDNSLKLKDIQRDGSSVTYELAYLADVPLSASALAAEWQRTRKIARPGYLVETKAKERTSVGPLTLQRLAITTNQHRFGAACGDNVIAVSDVKIAPFTSVVNISETSRPRLERDHSAHSTSDDSSATDEIDVPLDTLIRDQMRRQGMTAVLLMSLGQATGPAEVTDALSALEALLLRNRAAQEEFAAVGGYQKVFDMLLRVEENLALLAPCRDVSIAAAAGLPQQNRKTQHPPSPQTTSLPPHSSSPQVPSSSDSPDSRKSTYLSTADPSGAFDSYYTALLSVVLNLALDEPECTLIAALGPKPHILKKGLVLRNLDVLSLVPRMLNCGHASFTVLALRISFALLRTSPSNVVGLEAAGIVHALISSLAAVVFTCGLDKSLLRAHSDKADSPGLGSCRTVDTMDYESASSFHASHTVGTVNKDMLSIAADIVVVLQIVAVATSERDCSLAALLTLFMALASTPAEDIQNTSSAPVRCHNCEIESATLECIHDGCICDKCFRLCQECDKVFHKSALKRTHIRVPVINPTCSNAEIAQLLGPSNKAAKLLSGVETSAKLTNSLLKDGLSVDVCLRLLFDSLNDSTCSALQDCGICERSVDSVVSSLSNCNCDFADYAGYKERVIAVLVSGLRGLLDDRKARGQALPHEIFPSLLLSIRRLVLDPFHAWTAEDSASVPPGYDQSDLVDYRDDLLTPLGEIINKQNKHNDQYHQPPEIYHNSPRRIRLSLLIQTVARFVVSDSMSNRCHSTIATESSSLSLRDPSTSGPLLTGKQLLCCIDLLKCFGVDALLTHVLIDSTAYFTQMTLVDKQYTLWLLRECVVSATKLKPDRATRFLEWFLWLLRSDIVHLGAKSGPAPSKPESRAFNNSRMSNKLTAQKVVTQPHVAVHHNSYSEHIVAALPSTNPKISLLLRLLILQELRLLMAGDDKYVSKKADVFSQVLPSPCNLLHIPFAVSSADSYSSRSTSLDMEERQSFYSQTSRSHHGAPHPHTQMKTLNSYAAQCNVPATNSSIKVVLVQLGFVELLTEMVMGDMCSRPVTESLDFSAKPFFGKNNSAGAASSVGPVSELDKEDWWGAFSTFGQLLTCCDTAKEALDKYIGVQRVVSFLLPLLQYSSANMMYSHDHNINYAGVITGFIFELSVSAGTFASPTKPFTMTLPKFPQHLNSVGKVIPRDFKTPSPRMQRKTLSRAEITYEAVSSGLSNMLNRGSVTNLRPCNETSEHDFYSGDASFALNPAVCVPATTALCPVYFTHEKTVALVTSTVKYFPLTLTSESFRNSFSAIGSVTGHQLPSVPSGMQRSRSGTHTKSLISGRPPSFASPGSFDHLEHALLESRVPQSGISLSRKLMLKNMSSASVHSLEHDSPWELDSNHERGSVSGDVTGRASFHSHQSLLTLAHALKSSAQSAHTPTASVNGDTASILGNYLKSLKPVAEDHDAEHYRQQSPIADTRLLSSSGIVSTHNATFPFPPTTGNDLSSATPLVYFPFLKPLDSGLAYYASNVLVLLHHSLLIRSGLSGGLEAEEDDDLFGDPVVVENTRPAAIAQNHSPLPSSTPIVLKLSGQNRALHQSQQQDISSVVPIATPFDSVERCRQVLRKHLSMLLPPSYHYPSWQGNCDAWQPALSRLQIRSVECGELLVAVAVVTGGDIQSFVLSSLSNLLDGNPVNTHQLASKASTCVSLTRLLPFLREGLCETVGYIVSQVLRYSVQVSALRELISSVSREAEAAMVLARSSSSTAELFESVPEEVDEQLDIYNRNVLFVMGRSAERASPPSFLHFDLASPFESRVELPDILSVPSQSFSAFGWIRLGSMSDTATTALLQLSAKHSDVLVDVFFRVIHKLTPALSSMQQESSKKVVQLCLSFGKAVRAEISGEGQIDLGASQQSTRSALSSDATPTQNKGRTQQAQPQGVGESHWHLAVNQLLGIDEALDCDLSSPETPSKVTGSMLSSDDITDRTIRDSLSTIAASIARFSVPDAIVEFDWSALGDWHLLAIGVTDSSVSCFVDGRRVPVLQWSPMGYRYDSFSAALKEKATVVLPASLDMDENWRSPHLPAQETNSVVELPVVTTPAYWTADLRSDINRGNPLRVSLGGLLHESKAFDIVSKHVYSATNQAFYHSSPAMSWQLESTAQKASALLQAFSALVSGFSGSIGEFAVLDGPVDESQLKNCLREGPVHGLRDLHSVTRLSGVTGSGLPMSTQKTALVTSSTEIKSAAAPILQFPLMRTASPPPSGTILSEGEQSKLNIFGSQLFPAPDSLNKIGRTGREKDSASSVVFSEAVQIHHTNAVPDAVLALGGLRVLFPLLISDKARLVAALRVMGCIVTTSQENYRDFKASHIDKAVLYCCKSHPRLVTLETIQVLFELVSFCDWSGTFGTAVHTDSDHRIIRTTVLELVLDIVVTSPKDSQLARSAIDWLREICDDNFENAQKYLKASGLLPVLVILSQWGLGEVCLFPGPLRLDASLIKAAEVEEDARKSSPKHKPSSSLEGRPSTSYKPIEVSKKPSDARSSAVETRSAQQQAANMERFKLQVSCFRLLKLLICGTSGDIAQRASLSQNSTVTGFNASHVFTLMNFAVTSACSLIDADKSINGKDRHRKADYLRYSSQYAGMPVLSQIDFGSKEYWLFAGALVALDSFLNLVNGPLECTVINMLRLAYPTGNGLWHMILSLLGCACIELRQRAVTLLILSFSSSDGKIDVKQIALFERMHGFQLLAEQLSAHVDGCSDAMIDVVFSLIFWSHRSVKGGFKALPAAHNSFPTTTHGGDVTDRNSGGDNSELLATRARAISLGDTTAPSKEHLIVLEKHFSGSNLLTKDNRTAPRLISKDDSLVLPLAPSTASAAAQQTDTSIVSSPPSGGLMSMFGWSSSAADSKPRKASKGDIPSMSASTGTAASSPDSTGLLPLTATLPASAEKSAEGDAQSQSQASSASDHSVSLATALVRQSAEILSGEAEVAPRSSSPKLLSKHSHSHSNSSMYQDDLPESAGLLPSKAAAGDNTAEDFAVIQVPQAIEALVRLLQRAKSVDQVTSSFSKLEHCITLSAASHTTVRSQRKDSVTSASSGATGQKEKAISELVSRNADAIFAQKDWIMWLCDSLLVYRRRMLNSEDLDASSNIFSLSESESVGGGGDYDQSGAESEDCNSSVGGDSYSEDLSVNSASHGSNSYTGNSGLNVKSQAWQQHMITQFTLPVFNLVRRLLVLDMRVRYSSVRRWNEVLRLSLPETYDVQEAILLDLVDSLRSLPISSDGFESTMHFLRNMGALLEQVLEKADVTLMFCLKVVQALHSLSYQCPPEVRARIKETSLPEMRKNYVVRCLLDNSQGLHSKAFALSEIISPLQSYLSSTDSKVLTDYQVVVGMLGMFLDSHEELQMLFAAAATSGVHSSGSTEKLQTAQEIMRIVVSLVQSCVTSSLDCRKCVQRVLQDLPGDVYRNVTKAFMNLFEGSAGQQTQNNSTSAPLSAITSGSSAADTSVATYSWWGGWGSSSVSEQQPVQSSSSVVPDLESGRVPSESTTPLTSDTSIMMHDVSSFIAWLYQPEQSELRKELQTRISKEVKPVQRQLEKLRERFSQRYTRHTRALQDRRARDKFLQAKTVREALSAGKVSEDKLTGQFQKELKVWNTALVDRIELGKTVFFGSGGSDPPSAVKSPMKETGRGSGRVPSATATNSFSAESFAKIVVPENLKAYLSKSVPSSHQSHSDLQLAQHALKGEGLSDEDALNALICYFNSTSV